MQVELIHFPCAAIQDRFQNSFLLPASWRVFTASLAIDLFRGFLQQKKSWVSKQGPALIFCTLYLISLSNLIISTLVEEEGAAVKKSN